MFFRDASVSHYLSVLSSDQTDRSSVGLQNCVVKDEENIYSGTLLLPECSSGTKDAKIYWFGPTREKRREIAWFRR